jgi:ammonia channel protein AmtB
MPLPLRLALLTYANALLTYGALTFPETGHFLPTITKVATSLWWLLPLATPFALLFAAAGTPIVRHVLKRTAHLPRLASGALATLAFLIPAASVVETALALRDGISAPRFLLQVGGGLALAAAWAALTRIRNA